MSSVRTNVEVNVAGATKIFSEPLTVSIALRTMIIEITQREAMLVALTQNRRPMAANAAVSADTLLDFRRNQR